jgi:hypothetical protein
VGGVGGWGGRGEEARWVPLCTSAPCVAAGLASAISLQVTTVCFCCTQLSGIAQGFVSVDALESAYQEDTASNLVVLLLRLIVSGEVRRWVGDVRWEGGGTGWGGAGQPLIPAQLASSSGTILVQVVHLY